MTAIPQSDQILEPLRRVAKRQWLVLAARATIQASLIALALLLSAAILFGHWQSMPVALRVVLAALLWLTIFAALFVFVRPVLRKRELRHAAFAVEHVLPDAQERISSAVELSAESDPRFSGSPALLRRLVSQAEQDVAAVDPVAVVSTKQVKRWATLLAPILLTWLVLLPLMPRPILRGLLFTILPWRTDSSAILSEISVTPGDARVAQGDAIQIDVSVAESTAADRVKIVRRFPSGQSVPQDLAPPFSARFENLRESFQYRAESAGVHTRWYDVTVVPRPSVARLDVALDYPAYTAIDDRTETNAAGDIRAIVGTLVTLTVHSSSPIALGDGKSRIVLNKDRRDAQSIELTPVPDVASAYRASLFVQNSGTYQIHLLGTETLAGGVELWNADNQPRGIEALFDSLPTIAITSPKAEETVGPDDEVPVAFDAADDFGVAAVEAVVQVDDKPAKSFPLNLSAHRDRHKVRDEWRLSVPYHLAQAGVAEAGKITYHFKALDNRDPDPQSAVSAKQALLIRKDVRDSIATRLEAERVQRFQQTIDQTAAKLDQARPLIEPAKNPAAQPLTPEQVKQIEQAQQQLAQASKDLTKAAEENTDSGLKPVAEKAQKIADHPVRQAAENAAKAGLNPPQAEDRVAAATKAQQDIDAAKQQLAQLKLDVAAQQAKLESARLIDQAEHIQQQVAAEQAKLAEAREAAEAKAKQPNVTAQEQQAAQQEQQKLQQQHAALQQRQQESAARVQAAVQKEQSLQNAQAVEDAGRLAQLTQQITQLRQDQRPLEEQIAKQAKVEAVQQQADALAKRQEELNREINKFRKDSQPALQLAPAQAPAPEQLNNIAAALRQPNLQQANDLQKQTAQQLAQAAQALNAAANLPDGKGPAADQSKQAAAVQQQKIQQANQAGQQAAANLANAEKGNDANARTQAQKAAQQAAKDVAELAAKAVDQATQADKAADAAREQSKESAASAQAAEKAAGEQAAEAQRAAQAAAANAQADPQAAQKAADAQKAAQAARESADAMQKAAKLQAETAEKATKAADEAQLAAASAKELAESAQVDAAFAGKSADVVQKLQKAGEELQKASQHNAAAEQAQLAHAQQRAAADAAARAADLARKQADLAAATTPAIAELQHAQQGIQEPQAVASQQSQLAQRTTQAAQAAAQLQQAAAPRNADFAERAADAEKALKEAAAAQAAVAEAQAKEQQAQQAAQKARQESAQAASIATQADARADQADAAAQAQKDQSANLSRQAADLAKQSESSKAAGNDAQAAQLQQQSTQLEQQAQQTQQAAKAPSDQAAEARGATEKAVAEAAAANARAAEAQAQARAAQEASAAKQAAAATALARAEMALREPLPTSEQLASAKLPSDSRESAKPADPAASPQQQAMKEAAQNVQEAAQAQQQAFNTPQGNPLASSQAARALRDAAEAMARAVPESRRGQRAGDHAESGKQPDGKASPSNDADPSDGTRSADATGAEAEDDRPQNIKELGVSAADWARLGPLTRQELLNAAQQSGPPAYREQIKNYFVKIARLRNDAQPEKN